MTCKKLYAVAALCLLPVSALAAPKTTPGDLPDLPLESLYFGGENPVLTPAEQKALKIARDWQARSPPSSRPFPARTEQSASSTAPSSPPLSVQLCKLQTSNLNPENRSTTSA